VYIHDGYLQKGIASALYTCLFDILKRQGFRNLYAVINLPNERSVAFHERLGFKWFATYEQVGYKLGKWKNVGWWRYIVNDFGMEPDPPIAFRDLNKDFLGNLFTQKAVEIKNDE
jgi:phosphinothricin acetyltransferase